MKFIAATDTSTNTTVYLGTDERSGGYPCWFRNFQSANGHNSQAPISTIQEVAKDFSREGGYTFKKELVSPRIVTIEEIDSTPISFDIIPSPLEGILETLTDEQIEILKESGLKISE